MTETEEGMHGPEELAMEDEEGTEEEMSFSDPEDFEDDITEEGEAGVGEEDGGLGPDTRGCWGTTRSSGPGEGRTGLLLYGPSLCVEISGLAWSDHTCRPQHLEGDFPL